jgi:NAD-dependent SIR2 family protein deacetylase
MMTDDEIRDELMKTLRREGQACPSCGWRFYGTRKNNCDRSKPRGACRLRILVCTSCGGLMKVVQGRVWPLTRDDKKTLPLHRFAKEIRADQESRIRRMVG